MSWEILTFILVFAVLAACSTRRQWNRKRRTPSPRRVHPLDPIPPEEY